MAASVVEIDVQIIETDSACQKHYFADIISIFIETILGDVMREHFMFWQR